MQRSQLYATLTVAALSICAVAQLRHVAHIIPPSWSDLYSPWKASQAALRHENPYSSAVTDQIQIGVYDRVLSPSDIYDRQRFVYPAHIILFMAPLAFLPWLVVRIAVTAVAPIVVAGTLWLWLNLAGVRLSRTRQILLYGLVVTSWPAVWSYQLQQPSLFIFGAISLAIFYFSRQRDILSGLFLAVGTVKPNLIALLAIWVVVFAAFNRRWKFIGSFAASLCALIAAAELIVPGWVEEWIHAVTGYANEPLRLSLLGHLFGARIGFSIAVFLIAAAAVRLGYTRPGLLASAALLLSITVCIIPTTKWMLYNNLLLIPAAVMLIATEPSNKPKEALQLLARCALMWLACAAPISLLLALLLRKDLAMLPYFQFNAVLCITVCTLVVADRRTANCPDAHSITSATGSAVSLRNSFQ